MSLRPVKRLIKAKPTLEGAGVHLRRAFGFDNTSDFDPFLLLDDFRNDVPEDYLAGFPWQKAVSGLACNSRGSRYPMDGFARRQGQTNRTLGIEGATPTEYIMQLNV